MVLDRREREGGSEEAGAEKEQVDISHKATKNEETLSGDDVLKKKGSPKQRVCGLVD